jgi:hypothetical protein
MINEEVVELEASDEEDEIETKYIDVSITASFSFPDWYTNQDIENSVGAAVAIKSGLYENAAWGNVTSVKIEK